MTETGAPEAFIEKAEYEKGFAAYYQQHIIPLLANLEQDRKKSLDKFKTAVLIGAAGVITILCILLIARGPHDSIYEALIQSMYLFVPAAIWPCCIMLSYSHEAKSILLPPILQFFNLRYASEGMDPAGLKVFSIVPYYDSHTSIDNISGALDNVPFNLSQLFLSWGSGKNSRTTFRGIVAIFEMNKSFEGKTVLITRTLFTQPISEKLETVSLEDPYFNKTFDIRSSNQVEARYILTPVFLEQIIKLGVLMYHWGDDPSVARTGKEYLNDIRCSFYNNKLLLMVACNSDLFDPGNIFKPIYHIDAIRCVLYQVHLIRGIIETLKLNQHTGM